jgi:hypothetical protein
MEMIVMTKLEIKEMILNDWAELLMNAKNSVLKWINETDNVDYNDETLSQIKLIIEDSIKTGDPIIMNLNKPVVSGIETAFNMMNTISKAGILVVGPVKKELTDLVTSYLDEIPKVARENIDKFEV